jgi:hypothetical protein
MAGPLQLLKKSSSVGQIVYIVRMVCQEKVKALFFRLIARLSPFYGAGLCRVEKQLRKTRGKAFGSSAVMWLKSLYKNFL